MTWLLTHSGKRLDLLDPQPDMIDILDVAQGLANECRFAGQCKFYYSVAQHSVEVSRIVPKEFAWEALLHDAAEAYLKDIPTPLKQLLPDYVEIERRLEAAIRHNYQLPAQKSHAVIYADRVMLATERRDLMPDDGSEWAVLEGIRPLERRLIAVNSLRANTVFMRRFIEVLQESARA